MLKEARRRQIAREFIKEELGIQCFELFRSHKTAINNEARAFEVFPPVKRFFHENPYIGVAENEDEAIELANSETKEERLKAGLPEFEQYKNYWIVYD
jgi:hypothetical protein